MEKQTQRLRVTLLRIADDIDEHIKTACPYGLTFFFDKRVPLTIEQKKILEEYLREHFHDIWAKSWIKPETRKIRMFARAIREETRIVTIVDCEKLQEAQEDLRQTLQEVMTRVGAEYETG